MCGIAGFCGSKRWLTPRVLEGMRDTLTHRGPDDRGLVAWDERGNPVKDEEPAAVGLGHRRLSIIDLSADGRQPLASEDGRYTLVYNGEFYNFEDFVPDLVRKGHQFTSRTDGEVIVHLLEEQGIERTLANMNGMFAFAIWDRSSQTMILARDRLGKKPLYYALQADGSLLFASEMKALLASDKVDRGKVDEAALVQSWQFGYTVGERTFFRDIRRLLPGHYAVWKDGRLDVRAYWDCPFGVAVNDRANLDDLADELETLIVDAVRIRLKADVPVGLFLSGGIDSSLIAALTARVIRRPLAAFTISFDQHGYDEAPWAAAVAKHLDLDHRVLPVTESLSPSFSSIARQFDEPFGDSSAIPTFFVSKLARKHVTVALGGDGGDELFGGYESYAEGLGWWGNAEQKKMFHKSRRGLGRLWDWKQRLTPPARRLSVWQCATGIVDSWRLLSPAVRAGVGRRGIYGDRERWYPAVEQSDLLSQMQYVDLKTYLPDDILVKVDRMSMANSLECRSPLLDYRVVEFAARLPHAAKISGDGRRKVILRKILSRYLPDSLVDPPKKGFSIPWSTMWTNRAMRICGGARRASCGSCSSLRRGLAVPGRRLQFHPLERLSTLPSSESTA